MAQSLIGIMADRHDSERLRGFGDRQMNICNSRVAFATDKPFFILFKLSIVVTIQSFSENIYFEHNA